MDTVPTISVISSSLTGKEVGPWVHLECQLRSSLPFLRVENSRTAASSSSGYPSFPSQTPSLFSSHQPPSQPAFGVVHPLSGCLKDLPTPRAGPQNRKQLLASTEKEKNHKIQGCLCLQVTGFQGRVLQQLSPVL
ncbi:hypothetical protein LEMLEM_LOCUS5632 [Lemmus lemmus]